MSKRLSPRLRVATSSPQLVSLPISAVCIRYNVRRLLAIACHWVRFPSPFLLDVHPETSPS